MLTVAHFLPRIREKSDVVLSGINAAFLGEGESLLELRIHAVAGNGLHKILKLHLQHDVHTTLEVQTKVDLLGFALLVGVPEEYLLRRDGINEYPVLFLPDRIQIVSLVIFRNLGESR